jgi:holo-[acyl-carrier-protein] synthase
MRFHELIGVGVDIVEISRIGQIRFLDRFAEYFLTGSELKIFRDSSDPLQFIASRFAVKEAVIKACPEKLKPHEFEIAKDGKRPAVRFLSDKGVRYKVLISLAHSTEYAAGYAAVYPR